MTNKNKGSLFQTLEERITEVDEKDAVCEDQNTSFKVTRLSCRHSSSADFLRIVIFAFKYTGDELFEIISPLALQYYFENEEHKVIPRPHGNSKRGKVFHRTFESVKNKIRNELDKKCKPKEIVHTILSQQGGIHEITAQGKNRQ